MCIASIVRYVRNEVKFSDDKASCVIDFVLIIYRSVSRCGLLFSKTLFHPFFTFPNILKTTSAVWTLPFMTPNKTSAIQLKVKDTAKVIQYVATEYSTPVSCVEK